MKKRQKKLLWQFAEYMISGGAYFWVGYIVFFFCDKRLGLSLWWAKLISNLTGWTVNFLLQRFWVFKNPHLKGHLGEVSARYIFITLVNFGLDYLIIAWLKSVGITPYLGQFVSSGFFTVWNYLWYRFWVFPGKRHPAVRRLAKRSVARHLTSRHAAVSKPPVLVQRIEYTPHSALQFFLAAYPSGRHLPRKSSRYNSLEK